MAIQIASPFWAVLRLAQRSLDPRAVGMVWAVMLHLLLTLAPSLLLLASRASYQRLRAHMCLASVLTSGLCTYMLVRGVGTPALWQEVGDAYSRQRWLHLFFLYVVQPTIHCLTPWQQAVACIGQLATTSAMDSLSREGSLPMGAYLALAAAEVVLVSMLEARVRRQWLADGSGDDDGGATTAAHGSGVLAGSSAAAQRPQIAPGTLRARRASAATALTVPVPA